jgi:hypothetical protein
MQITIFFFFTPTLFLYKLNWEKLETVRCHSRLVDKSGDYAKAYFSNPYFFIFAPGNTVGTKCESCYFFNLFCERIYVCSSALSTNEEAKFVRKQNSYGFFVLIFNKNTF